MNKSNYIFFNNTPDNYIYEALGNYEKEDAEHESLADENLIFYIRINTENAALVKIFKAGDIDDRWELSVIEGDNTALDEMEFDPEFSKMEILTYLADIYEDVEEVDDEFLDDVIEDDEDIDAEFDGEE